MNKMLQIISVIIIIVSGIGGILTGTYPIIGTCLVLIGIAWQVFSHVSTERKSQTLEQLIEVQNKLLAQSNLGNPYTEIVKKEFKEKGHFKEAINDVNPFDREAMEYYVIIMALTFSFKDWVNNIDYGPQNKDWLFVYHVAERGHNKYPKTHVFLDAMGILLDIAGKHKDARKMFRKSSKLRADPFWHVLMSTSYGMSKRPDLAFNEIESAKDKGLNGWIIEYNYAAIQSDLGNYDRALDHVRKAYESGGTIPQIREIELKCLFANGKLIASGYSRVKLAWQLLLLNPKKSFLLLFGAFGHLVIMIIIFFSKKIWPLTSHIPLIRRIQLKYFSPLEPEFTVGCSLVEKMHFKKAIELFNQCRKVNPRDVSVLMNLGLCYARDGDSEKAITITKEALAIEPDNNALKYNLDVFLSGIKLNGLVLVDNHGNFIKRIDAKPKP